MEGKNQVPREAFEIRHRSSLEGPVARNILPQPLVPIHFAAQEEVLEMQHHRIQRLLDENHQVVEDRNAMQRELAAAKEELHRLNHAISGIQEEKDRKISELFERSLTLEADLRATEPLKNEVVDLRALAGRLNSLTSYQSDQIRTLSEDLKRLHNENQQIPVLRARFDGLQQELIHARAAIENEKKAKSEVIEQRQEMQRSLVFMAGEVERLRAERAYADVRPWEPAGQPHGLNSSSSGGGLHAPYGGGNGVHMGALDNGALPGSASGSCARLDRPRVARR